MNNPPQVVLAALRVLNNIATATKLAPLGADDTSSLSEALFSPRPLEALCAILWQESTDRTVLEQKRLVARLICQLGKGTVHQNALVDSGILDALATMLAAVATARGEVVPGAQDAGQPDSLADLIPAPGPPDVDLASVLEALATIVANSRFRSYLLICSPVIMATFPSIAFPPPPVAASKWAWDALESGPSGSARVRIPGAMDYLLPDVSAHRSVATKPRGLEEFPPLGFPSPYDDLGAKRRSSAFKFTGVDATRQDVVSGEDEDVDEPESPLVPWLIVMVRSTEGLERIAAASLVTSLFKAGFGSPVREQHLATLVIPLLCQLLKDNDKEIPASTLQSDFVDPNTAKQWAIQERAADVLARLVGESEALQQAAHGCGIIKVALKLLKDSYDPQPVQTPPKPWSPTPEGAESDEGLPTCRIGVPGFVPAYAHKIKLRENVLKLVAAMATLSNDYREALVAGDVVPYIVESLSATPGKPSNARDRPASEKAAEDGDKAGPSPYGRNPNAVILAACHATRALSRLPSIVRTAMQDYGFAAPLNKLLRHPDAEVQTAASGVVINLVTNCSPLVQVSTSAWF